MLASFCSRIISLSSGARRANGAEVDRRTHVLSFDVRMHGSPTCREGRQAGDRGGLN